MSKDSSKKYGTIILNNEVEPIVMKAMQELAKTLPYSAEFDGLDFRGSPLIVIVNIRVRRPDGRFVLLQRSTANGDHVGEFNFPAGFMNGDGKSPKAISTMLAELSQEIGYKSLRGTLTVGEVFEIDLPGKKIVVVPGHLELGEDIEIDLHSDKTLEKEHDSLVWVNEEELASFEGKVVPIVHQVSEKMNLLVDPPAINEIGL